VLKLVLKDYKHWSSLIVLVSWKGKKFLLISNMPPYQTNAPFQAKMLPTRIALGIGCKKLIAMPFVWSCLEKSAAEKLSLGELLLITDHVNISCFPPGTGPNVDICGPRFYDSQSIYNKEMRLQLEGLAKEKGINLHEGQALFVHSSTVPSYAHAKIANAFKTDKIDLKVMVKNGIAELLAMAHRRSISEYPLTSAAIGIVSDSVIRKQSISKEPFAEGVKKAFDLIIDLA